MKNELVSIIMPVYNRSTVISKSITSILNQDYENWELIVVDDYSTDDTFAVVKKIAEIDSRVSIYMNTHSKGVSGARNTGFENIKGKYIAFLDSDDEWENFHLSESLYYMDSSSTDVSFALWSEKLVSGKIQKRFGTTDQQTYFENQLAKVSHKKLNDAYIFYRDFYEFTINNNFVIYHINSLVMKSCLLESVGLFDETLHASEDTDFIFRLLRKNNFVFINKNHFYYSQGDDNIYNFINRREILLDELILNDTYVKKISFCISQKCKMYKKRIYSLKQDKHELSNYKRCIKSTKCFLSKKFLVLFYINRVLNKKQVFYYLLNFFICNPTVRNLKIFLNYLIFKSTKLIKENEINLY